MAKTVSVRCASDDEQLVRLGDELRDLWGAKRDLYRSFTNVNTGGQAVALYDQAKKVHLRTKAVVKRIANLPATTLWTRVQVCRARIRHETSDRMICFALLPSQRSTLWALSRPSVALDSSDNSRS